MAEISIKAEKLFEIWGFPVTNALVLAVISALIILALAFLLKRQLRMIPGKFQGFFEFILDELLSLMDSVLPSRQISEKYLPIIATIFIFIMLSNWLGLLPGVGAINFLSVHPAPLLRSPASDLNFTIALGIISILSVNLLGIGAIGLTKHFSKFFTVKSPINSFVGILEFISEFVKIISFSFRLFGNVFAGEVLLTIVGFLVPYFLPLPFLALELFVGFIQAFIFSMLTLVFIAMAVQEPAH
ncbi:F0F1 ATP synthase subunit A [Candidatus Giovannonibacteria bacterium]|nr:F0F1 ATP synthase subunit A [Candidatus Giovannonibacteria bacterium]